MAWSHGAQPVRQALRKARPSTIDSWSMHGEDAPVFAEYLALCQQAGFHPMVEPEEKTIGAKDALIIVDMQNDFIPKDSVNEHGRLASTEGGRIAELIVQLAEHFAFQGGMVIATRDYHPVDHCSFLENGGPCLPHCVQGNAGSHFYKPIGDCIERLHKDGSRVAIVFKGFHEDVESFGSFTYSKVPPPDRGPEFTMTDRCPIERFYGCASLAAWTGSFCLKCSNLEFEGKFDVNAPPDVLSSFRRETLADRLQKSDINRVFVCGLVFDLCVMDTGLNAIKAGFKTYLIMDASRPCHVPGIGPIGSGFISPVEKLKERMAAAGLVIVPSVALLHSLLLRNPLADRTAAEKAFPMAIGPFRLNPLARAEAILTRCERDGYWKISSQFNHASDGTPDPALDFLKHHHIEATGTHSPPSKITLGLVTREARAGIPREAVSFIWANPVEALATCDQGWDHMLTWLTSLNSTGSFLLLGGFMYLDRKGKVVSIMALQHGEGLSFGSPVKWSGAYTEALRGRWASVTIPFMKDKGANYFAWINPGERPAAPGEEPLAAKFTEHGAFAYLFGKTPRVEDQRDVLFPLVEL